MKHRRLLLIATLWVATVLTASTATWGVISVTGAKVGQTIPLSSAASSAATPLPSPSQRPSGDTDDHHSEKPPVKPSHPAAPPPNTAIVPTTSDSWSGSAGTVVAACSGPTISLMSAVPYEGYRVQVERSDTELQIEFEAARESEETHLKVTCVNGRPSFRHE